MRLICTMVLLLAIVACESPNTNDDFDTPPPVGGEPDTGGDDNPRPRNLVWGDLVCQKEKNCENPIFNLSKNDLVDFLKINWDTDKTGSKRQQTFLCGARFSEDWSTYFPEHQSLEPVKWLKIAEFAPRVLDIETCRAKSNPMQQIERYFKSEQENSNEN